MPAPGEEEPRLTLRRCRSKSSCFVPPSKSLTESLAISNSEAETFKRQAADLTLKIEALGIPGVEKGPEQARATTACRGAGFAPVEEAKRKRRSTSSSVLPEAVQVMIKSSESIDPQARLAVETELRKTNEILGAPNAAKAGPVEATLDDGMVVDVKEDLALGRSPTSAKSKAFSIGMPFQVWREDKRIGEVRVVDVRESISGAVIQSLESEKVPVKTGDRLKVDARR